MIEKKNIDRLFQEKFKDFEVLPSDHVWENIEEALQKKKKRRVIPIWFKMAGVAAALIIGILIAFKFAGSQNVTPDTNVVNADTIQTPQSNPSNIQTPEVIASDDEIAPENNDGKARGNASGRSNTSVAERSEVENSNGTEVQNNKNLAPGEQISGSRSQVASGENLKPRTQRKMEKSAGQGVPDRMAEERVASSGKNGGATTGNAAQNAVAASNENQTETKDLNPRRSDGNVNGIDQKPKVGEIAVAGSSSNGGKDKAQDLISKQNNNQIITSEEVPDNAVAESDMKKDSTGIATAEPNALEELAKEKEKVTVTEPKLNRWQLTSNVAPIYFSSASNGSPLDSRFEDAPKAYKTSMSYGVGVAYAINKKFSVRSGVNSVALEYNTTDVVFFQTPNARQIQNVRTNVPGSLIEVDADPGEMSMAGKAGNARFDGILNQKIGYVEVPVEMSYKFLDRKFGVEVIGGFSTLILNQNEVSVAGSGIDMNIGEAKNLNDVHFSTNIGLGLKYNFLKAFQFKIEPILKYQLNTFSNDAGNFKPYFFGVYTGLNYRF